MSRKIRNLFTNLLQAKSSVLSRKSNDVVQSFVDMIERLNKINEEVDCRIAEANEVKAKLDATTEELEKTKAHNEAIKAKIENIIA